MMPINHIISTCKTWKMKQVASNILEIKKKPYLKKKLFLTAYLFFCSSEFMRI